MVCVKEDWPHWKDWFKLGVICLLLFFFYYDWVYVQYSLFQGTFSKRKLEQVAKPFREIKKCILNFLNIAFCHQMFYLLVHPSHLNSSCNPHSHISKQKAKCVRERKMERERELDNRTYNSGARFKIFVQKFLCGRPWRRFCS